MTDDYYGSLPRSDPDAADLPDGVTSSTLTIYHVGAYRYTRLEDALKANDRRLTGLLQTD